MFVNDVRLLMSTDPVLSKQNVLFGGKKFGYCCPQWTSDQLPEVCLPSFVSVMRFHCERFCLTWLLLWYTALDTGCTALLQSLELIKNVFILKWWGYRLNCRFHIHVVQTEKRICPPLSSLVTWWNWNCLKDTDQTTWRCIWCFLTPCSPFCFTWFGACIDSWVAFNLSPYTVFADNSTYLDHKALLQSE